MQADLLKRGYLKLPFSHDLYNNWGKLKHILLNEDFILTSNAGKQELFLKGDWDEVTSKISGALGFTFNYI